MKGHPEIIEVLNAVLTAELTAINQYFIHYKMCEDWGYVTVAKKKRSESIEEMKHAELVIDRILYLGGIPNMQRYNPVRVGEDVVEMHRVDLELELEAVKRLNDVIKLCFEKGDNGTRDILAEILESEEEGIHWLESQLHVIEEIGKERYLAEQLKD